MLSGSSQDSLTRSLLGVAERFVGAAGRLTAGVAVTLDAIPVILMLPGKLALSDKDSAACTEKIYAVPLANEEISVIVVVSDLGESETNLSKRSWLSLARSTRTRYFSMPGSPLSHWRTTRLLSAAATRLVGADHRGVVAVSVAAALLPAPLTARTANV